MVGLVYFRKAYLIICYYFSALDLNWLHTKRDRVKRVDLLL